MNGLWHYGMLSAPISMCDIGFELYSQGREVQKFAEL